MTLKPQKKTSKDLIAKGTKYYVPNYKPRPMILDHGKGSRIWDLDGNEYIDFSAGIAVSALGHQNPALVKALITQAKKLWHTSNVFFTAPPIELAEALVKNTFASRVYLCNSGTEANEAAIKLVRKYASGKGRTPEQREIITFTGSFHGRTLAAVTATAQPKYQQGYEPLPGGFSYVKFNDFDAIAQAVSEKTCAIMVEPIQGEGGITPAAPGFLKHLRALCDKVGALLVFDEIQSGIGRTGKFLAYQYEAGIMPDIVTLAKGLGGGIPIGAMLVGEKAAETFQFGAHGSTFGGNPVACAVALEVVKQVKSKALMQNVIARGKELKKHLENINKETGLFAEIRGRGLMIGAELKPNWHGKAPDIMEVARRHGVMILQAGPNVLRFVPPLTINAKELTLGIARVRAAIKEYLGA